MHILLPRTIKSKLEEDTELTIIVNQAIITTQKIYSDSLYFFPEYTNHGAEHISSVLEVSARLISPQTLETMLTPTDVALLILAILYHDIGMHLTFDGFKQLLNGKFDSVICLSFDSQTWTELWNDYILEAKRFNSKQLKAIFGDENASIEIPKENLSINQRLLIGEFLRRHHARLAHEIAIIGFPGISEYRIDLTPLLTVQEKDLAGVIARSHGTLIRKTYAHIKGKFHSQAWKHPGNTYTFFLMAVLRIADYIQIDRTRTSDLTLKLKSFASPISVIEHHKHLAVKSVQYSGLDDGELLLVEAYPNTCSIYLRLQKLISDIQLELDISWATLGEIYGKDDEQYRPEIQFRRITSNIDEDTFKIHQNYVAEKFNFDTDPDIVKMLIAPLYGNKPRFGIRELIQNSVDACNEMEFICQHDTFESGYIANIVITVNKEENGMFFEIEDNGKGMTADEIKNYFIRTASSYRKSLGWKKKFINKNGETSLQKAGRFGIGVLASFLLGNELEVWTSNHQNGKGKGLYFKCMLDDENIEIIKMENICLQGTRIRIKLEESIFSYLTQPEFRSLNFRWFAFSKPKITFNILGNEYTPFKPWETYPHFEANPGPTWNAFKTKDFRKILWSNPPTLLTSAYLLNCNGIDICKEYGFTDPLLRAPKLVVFDFEAKLPLTIDRNNINEDLPFMEDLKDEMCKKVIADLLLFDALKGNTFESPCLKEVQNPKSFLDNYNRIVINNEGFILNYGYFWDNISKSDFKLIVIDGKLTPKDYNNRFFIGHGDRENIMDKADLLIWNRYESSHGVEWNLRHLDKRTVYSDEGIAANIFDPDLLTLFDRYRKSRIGFALFHRVPPCYVKSDALDKCLGQYLGTDAIIPHNLDERVRKFPIAFKELKPFMKNK